MIWDDDDYYAMHFGLTDDEIFWAAWHSVWCTGIIALPVPRRITPPRHSPRQLGRRLFLPLPRSGIGGGRSTPAHLPHTHARTH